MRFKYLTEDVLYRVDYRNNSTQQDDYLYISQPAGLASKSACGRVKYTLYNNPGKDPINRKISLPPQDDFDIIDVREIPKIPEDEYDKQYIYGDRKDRYIAGKLVNEGEKGNNYLAHHLNGYEHDNRPSNLMGICQKGDYTNSTAQAIHRVLHATGNIQVDDFTYTIPIKWWDDNSESFIEKELEIKFTKLDKR